jgi:flagellar biosynthesis regulator FlaF
MRYAISKAICFYRCQPQIAGSLMLLAMAKANHPSLRASFARQSVFTVVNFRLLRRLPSSQRQLIGSLRANLVFVRVFELPCHPEPVLRRIFC